MLYNLCFHITFLGSYLQDNFIVVLYFEDICGRRRRGMTVLGQRGDSGILIRRWWRCWLPVSVTALSITFATALFYWVVCVENGCGMRSPAVLVSPSLDARLSLWLRLRGYHLVDWLLRCLRALLLTSLLLLAVILVYTVAGRLDRSLGSSTDRSIPSKVAAFVALYSVEQPFRTLWPLWLARLFACSSTGAAVCAIEERVRGLCVNIRSLVQGIRQMRMATGQRAAIHGVWYFRATSMCHRCLAECVIPTCLDTVRLTVLAARLMSKLSGISSVGDSVQRRRMQWLRLF